MRPTAKLCSAAPRPRAVVLLVCANVLSACSAYTCDEHGAWSTFEAHPIDRHDELLFTFEAPAGTTGGPEAGLDSHLGDYSCQDVALRYDYGGWSDSLDEAAATPGAIDDTRIIDGWSARVVRWQEPEDPEGRAFHGAVHFPRMLTFRISGVEERSQELALDIFDTIRFR